MQVSSGKEGSNNDVIMVDPVEAKRLAAKQMERIRAKEKLKVKAVLCLDFNHICWCYCHLLWSYKRSLKVIFLPLKCQSGQTEIEKSNY